MGTCRSCCRWLFWCCCSAIMSTASATFAGAFHDVCREHPAQPAPGHDRPADPQGHADLCAGVHGLRADLRITMQGTSIYGWCLAPTRCRWWGVRAAGVWLVLEACRHPGRVLAVTMGLGSGCCLWPADALGGLPRSNSLGCWLHWWVCWAARWRRSGLTITGPRYPLRRQRPLDWPPPLRPWRGG